MLLFAANLWGRQQPPTRNAATAPGNLVSLRSQGFTQGSEEITSKSLPGHIALATWLIPVSPVLDWQQDPVAGDGAVAGNATPPAPPLGADSVEDPPALTLETVAARRAGLESRTDLDEETKQQVIKHFDRAVEFLNQAADAEKRRSQLRTERDNAPTTIAELKAQLEQPGLRIEPEVPAEASLAELEQLRLADDESLTEARKNLEQWEARAKVRVERRPQMATIIEAARNQVAEAKQALSVPPSDTEQTLLSLARRTEQEALLVFLQEQFELLRIEQSRYEALNDAFPLQRDLLTRNKNALEKRQERWREILAQARLAEAERQQREALRKLRDTDPALKSLAARNSDLTLRRQEHQKNINAWKSQLSSINDTYSAIEQKFNSVLAKEKRLGRSTAIGLTLRSQRSYLPDERLYRRVQRNVEQEIISLQTEQLQLEDERKELTDIESQLDSILSEIKADDVDRDELRKMARELLGAKRDYLDGLLSDFDAALAMLNETDFSSRRLSDKIREFQTYIDERVLWIRSGPAVDAKYPRRTWECIQSFVTHHQWSKLGEFLASDFRQAGPLYWLLVALVGIGSYLKWRLPQVVSGFHRSVRSPLQSGVPQALAAGGLALIAATPAPGALMFLSWRLGYSDLELSVALRSALMFTAVVLYFVGMLRIIFARRGIAELLIEWPVAVVHSLRRNFLLYLLGGVPLGFVIVMANRFNEGVSTETVGRLSLLALCVLLLLVLRNIFRGRGALSQHLRQLDPTPLVARYRWLWYPPMLMCPVLLGVLSSLGYQYTAEQLFLRFELTLGLLALLCLAYSLVSRWAMTARRQLALKQARARREAALAADKPLEEARELANLTEVEQLNLTLIKHQVLRFTKGIAVALFLVGCWFIWSQVLPALQVFSKIELWSIVGNVTETLETAEGVISREVNKVTPITLGHVLRAMLVLALALTASRNLPGLLELSVLQKLPLNHGNRTTIKILAGYAFAMVGLIVASNMIGLRWNSIQWLAAGLTVGLGFGLQEIFANFVSGLIILFERPIRLGDVVTIDGVTGAVTRIQIRATTITDWDRREFIVPNKEFVTGRLLNWTLSDTTNRVVVNVAVQHDSDVQLALSLLLQIAEAHPGVLRDPLPQAIFESFGESSLNLGLRVYLPNLENRLQVMTELNLEIERRFRAAGIKLAYPQRDLHIRSIDQAVLVNTRHLPADGERDSSPSPAIDSSPISPASENRECRAA